MYFSLSALLAVVIDTLLAGYTWQELQVMYRWFQLYLSNFDAGIYNVLIRHLTQHAPYMGQVLSSMGAHSVSGGVGHFLISLDVIQRVRGGWKERFIHRHHQLYTKCQPHVVPVPIFSVLYAPGHNFYGAFSEVAIWVNPDRQSAP